MIRRMTMDVDKDVFKGGSSGLFKFGMCAPKPWDTEAGQVSPDRMVL